MTPMPTSTALTAALAQDPALASDAITQLTALTSDKWIYRIVVLALGIAVLVGMLGLIVLSWKDVTNLPQGLVAIASAAVGALAGLLAPSPTNKG